MRVAIILDLRADLGMILDVFDDPDSEPGDVIGTIESQKFEYWNGVCQKLGFPCYAREYEEIISDIRGPLGDAL